MPKVDVAFFKKLDAEIEKKFPAYDSPFETLVNAAQKAFSQGQDDAFLILAKYYYSKGGPGLDMAVYERIPQSAICYQEAKTLQTKSIREMWLKEGFSESSLEKVLNLKNGLQPVTAQQSQNSLTINYCSKREEEEKNKLNDQSIAPQTNEIQETNERAPRAKFTC